MLLSRIKGFFMFKPCKNITAPSRLLLCLNKHFVFDPAKCVYTEIDVPFDSIVEYTDFLEEMYYYMIDNAKEKPPVVTNHRLRTVYIGNWAVGHDKRMLDDPNYEMKRFLRVSLNLTDFVRAHLTNFKDTKKHIGSSRLQAYVLNINDVAKVLSNV